MDKKHDISVNLQSGLEQLESLVSNLAPTIASYYKSLITEGVPHSLAEDLVRDWHTAWWEAQFRAINP